MPLYAEFVLGLRHRPEVEVTYVHPPVVLDEALLPGVTVIGHFEGRCPARITRVVGGVAQEPRGDTALIGFHARVYSDGPVEGLAGVFGAALRGCLGHPALAASTAETGRACLAKGHEGLEDLPMFELMDSPPDDPVLVSLSTLRRASSIFVPSPPVGRDLLREASARGALCLVPDRVVFEILRAHGIPFAGTEVLEEEVLGSDRVVPLRLRQEARPLRFADGRWKGERLEFPARYGDSLVLDFARRRIESGSAGISFEALARADVDLDEVCKDNKTDQTFYLLLCDGTTNLVFRADVRTYDESPPELFEERQQAERTCALIHALPGALGCPSRMARPDLVTGLDLRALL